MSEPSYADKSVFVDVNELGNTEFHHRPCGKVWYEKQGDNSPNYCPGCGEELFTENVGEPEESE